MTTTPIVTAATTEFIRQLAETARSMSEDQTLDMYWILVEQLAYLKVSAALNPTTPLLEQYRNGTPIFAQ